MNLAGRKLDSLDIKKNEIKKANNFSSGGVTVTRDILQLGEDGSIKQVLQVYAFSVAFSYLVMRW